MNLKDNINIINKTAIIKIKVVVNSSKNELFSVMENGVLKIRIKQIPENGKANKELINFISQELGIKKNQIKFISGLIDKNKTIRIDF